jgi:hypothetical protein
LQAGSSWLVSRRWKSRSFWKNIGAEHERPKKANMRDELERLIQKKPFIPFTIRMNDGRGIEVLRLDDIGPLSTWAVVVLAEDAFDILPYRNMSGITVKEPQWAQGPDTRCVKVDDLFEQDCIEWLKEFNLYIAGHVQENLAWAGAAMRGVTAPQHDFAAGALGGLS